MKRSRQLSIMALCAVAALGITVSSCDEDASNSSVKAKSGDSCASVECDEGLVCNADKVCEKAETPDPGDEPGKVGDDCDADHACADDLECKDGKCAEKTGDPEDPPVDPGPGPKEDPCEGVNCPDGKQCLNAQCLDPGCIVDGAEKACDAGQMCAKGECIDDGCQDKSCGEGEVCSKGLCEDAVCLEKAIVCNDGSTCVKGACVENECLEQTCDTGLTCSKGACVYPACVGKDACDPGKTCNESGECVFADAPALKAVADKNETDENGAVASIELTLNNPPSKDVTVKCELVPEEAAAEVELSCEGILFDALNYSEPQTVHVVGLPDNKIDADQNYTIKITTESEDSDFNGLSQSIDMVNKNVDTVGVKVIADKLTTTESGGSAVFSVVLKAKPEADVTFEVSSSNPDYGYIDGVEEGSDKLVVTFTPENWDVPQEIKVVGKDEAEDKNGPNTEDHIYKVQFSNTSSDDPNYKDLPIEPIDVLNIDNDIADAFLDKTELLTEEDGVQEDIRIRLGLAPKGPVNVSLAILQSDKSNDSAEVELLTPETIELNSENYNDGVVISLKGVDDHIIDGDQDYYLRLRFSSNKDDRYNALEDRFIPGKNIDKNIAGFVKSYSDLVVSEDMTSIEIGLALASIPTAPVTVSLSSSDKSEISVKPATMTFTADDWDKQQTITVKGLDDVIVDGDIVSEVRMKAESEDQNFGGDGAEIPALEDKIEVTTLDNDRAAIIVAAEGAEVMENSGKNVEIKVVLSAQPETQVIVSAKSSDISELQIINQATMIFTEENWNVPQTVILTVQDDSTADGTQTVYVEFSSTSDDALFDDLAAKSPAYNILDDESASVTLTATKAIFNPGDATTTTVRVALSAQPEGDVPVKLNTTDSKVIQFSKSDLVFTSDNWSKPQEVTMTVNPGVAPSNKAVTKIDALASGTGSYKSLKSNVVDVTTKAFQSKSFAYTGGVQSLALLPGRYKLEVWGASGAYGWEITRGGYGGYAQGVYNLAKAGTMYVVVGGQGVVGGAGYNGGGPSGNGPAGGGATHIALNNNKGVLSNYVSNQGDVLIVAGGGGGSERCTGGGGGGASGNPGDVAGCTSGYGSYTQINTGGGTQTAGGVAGKNSYGVGGAGSFGLGGSGNASTSGDNGPGGGGGWYGGGGMPWYGGGGGGSGHLGSGVTGSMTNGQRNGHGAAIITSAD